MRSVAAWLLSLVIGCAGCASRTEHARQALDQFQNALTLSLTVPSVVLVGQQTTLRFRLQNTSSRTIDACIGEGRSVWMIPEDDTQGNERLGIAEQSPDRPRCQRRFRLAPAAEFEWNESTAVPGIVRGFARLGVDIQVVDPRHCHPVDGCPDMTLTASTPIEIR